MIVGVEEVPVADARWDAVDRYYDDLLLGDDPVLDAALDAARQAGLPPINVSAAQGKFLHLLARACGARAILEVGTLAGYSAIWLARALPADGRLVTLEYEPRHAEVATRNLAAAGLADRVSVRVGAAADTLARMVDDGEGPFDLVFLDADKGGYADYLTLAVRMCRPGAVIVADNVVRDGQIVDPDSPEAGVAGIRRFTDRLRAEPRLSATVLQTVGSKGYDGFTLAVLD